MKNGYPIFYKILQVGVGSICDYWVYWNNKEIHICPIRQKHSMENINRKPICRNKSISLKNHKKNWLIKATTFRLTHNYWNIYWDWNPKQKCFSYVSAEKEKTLVNFWFTRVYLHLSVPRPGTSHRNHRKIKEIIFLIINHLSISYFLYFCHILPIFRYSVHF